MTSLETGAHRPTDDARRFARRRSAEMLTLIATSVALLFTLAIAFGLISG